MKGLILAGGTGTRLRPITHTGPKQLIPIANKPNILYCLEDLRDAGVREIGVILGHNMPQQVRDLLKDGSPWGVRITYIEQGEPRGIAHAIGVAEPFLRGGPFIVYLGDNVLKGGVRDLVADYEREKPAAVIGLCKVPNPQAFGVAVLGPDGRLLKTIEKPAKPPTDLAVIGVYLFTDPIFGIIRNLKPSGRNELEVTDAITRLLEGGQKVTTHVVKGWWKDTGRPEDILEVNRLVLDDLEMSNQGTVDATVRMTGRVGVGPGTRILAGTKIQGPVIIGRNCVIGPNATVGPYTAVGDSCTLAGANVADSVLLEGVTVRSPRPIRASLIGKHVQILDGSEGATPSHQLFVGENSVLRL